MRNMFRENINTSHPLEVSMKQEFDIKTMGILMKNLLIVVHIWVVYR